MSGLGFHIGASTGKQTGTLPTFRTSATQTYFSYASGVAAEGTRTRVSPAVFYYFKSFGGFAEFMRSTQEVSRAGVLTDVANRGWDVTTSYVVTGDTTTDRGVRPKNNFDPAAGHWGALQLLARVAKLSADSDAFTNGLAASTASREAKQWSVEANWYPNYWIKYYVSYERTAFAGGNATRPSENAVIVRTQLAF